MTLILGTLQSHLINPLMIAIALPAVKSTIRCNFIFIVTNCFLHRTDGIQHRSSSHHRHRDQTSVIGTSNGASTSKKPRLEAKSSNGGMGVPSGGTGDTSLDVNSSDHVVAVTQLKEQLSLMQKQLARKDQEMLEKDKKVSITLFSIPLYKCIVLN